MPVLPKPKEKIFEVLRWSKSLSWLEPIQEQGFAIIPGILEPKEIDGLLDEFGRRVLPRSKPGARHVRRLPAVAGVAQDSRLMGIVREALGKEAFPFRATLFDKSPTANWL